MIIKVVICTILFVFGMGALVAWILFELSKAAAEKEKHDVEHKNF